jgi:hypothetical protein
MSAPLPKTDVNLPEMCYSNHLAWWVVPRRRRGYPWHRQLDPVAQAQEIQRSRLTDPC